MEFPGLHKAEKWGEKILRYPGIEDKALTLRKDYRIASVACSFVIFWQNITVCIINPHLKILITYGMFQIILYPGNIQVNFNFCCSIMNGEYGPAYAYFVAAKGDKLFASCQGQVLMGRLDDHTYYVNSCWRDPLQI